MNHSCENTSLQNVSVENLQSPKMFRWRIVGFRQTLLQRCCNVCVTRAHCNNRAIYESFENFAATLYAR